MSKKLFTGILLGGAATAASWALLPEKKRQALREQVSTKANDIADYVTDYALTALDIVDERLAEMDNAGVAGNVKAAGQKIKDKKDQVIDHLTNDEFDEQTAAIREKLSQAGSSKESTDDDIVIDATSDSDDSDDQK